jgi:hypothetical protein
VRPTTAARRLQDRDFPTSSWWSRPSLAPQRLLDAFKIETK